MVQKTGIIVQKKNYTLRTWQTEDAASLAKYLNNKNIWDNCRDGLPYFYLFHTTLQCLIITK